SAAPLVPSTELVTGEELPARRRSTSTSRTPGSRGASPEAAVLEVPLTQLRRGEGSARCRTLRYRASRLRTSRLRTPRLSTPRHSTPRRSSPRLSTPRHSTPRHSTPRVSTPRLSTPRLSTHRHSTPRLSTPRLSTRSRTRVDSHLNRPNRVYL
ncbi:unnamed protein product, partial [Closterium sp. NIES-53]